MRLSCRLAALLLFAAPLHAAAQSIQRFADLGTCPTAGGEPVRDCRIGYRTYGRLNARRDNAVLVPTWHAGRSETMTFLLGPDGWVDTTRYYAILMDAPGNGVSSSPSNSRRQPLARFPRLTLEDMVDAEHRVVTQALGIPRLHAVLGWSMGGMQAIVWKLRYPEAVHRAVSVAGTPRMSTYDLYWVRSMLTIIDLAERSGLPHDTLAVRLAELWHTVATTPGNENAIPRERMDAALGAEARGEWVPFHPADNRLQLQAVVALDASALARGRIRRSLASELLLVFVPEDHVTTVEPFRQFARETGADTVAFASRCGHMAPVCETTAIGAHVRRYLDTPSPISAAR